MYLPGLITCLYIYLAIKKSKQDPSTEELRNVLCNLIIAEVIWLYTWFNFPFNESFSFTNLVMFFIIQDVYFYIVHKLLHLYFYKYHKLHHSRFDAVLGWHSSIPEHILLNLGSFAFAFWCYPNTSWILFILIIMEIYTSINGHTDGSKHHVHHLNMNKRFGALYLVDIIMDTYDE